MNEMFLVLDVFKTDMMKKYGGNCHVERRTIGHSEELCGAGNDRGDLPPM